MGRGRTIGGSGRWRLFRHEAGRAAGPPAWAYVLLYVVCQLIGLWSIQTFHATVLWPANAILVAALLQLHRNRAITVTLACVAINLTSNVVRGDPAPFVATNAGLNLLQAVVCAVLARRVCGAALDMRRPPRLFRFAVLAVTPAVALSTALAGAIAVAGSRLPAGTLAFRMHHLFDMEMLALMIVTPSLLLLARRHRFGEDAAQSGAERAALIGLVAVTALWAFTQTLAPILFIIFPPVVLLAFRLSPPWTAATVILVAAIGGVLTLNGHGPIVLTHLAPEPALAGVPDVMRRLNVFHLFLLAVAGTALPISTLSTERQRLMRRLEARTQAALQARARAEQADAAKSRFLALMSHEMRTPLTAVTGYADLLTRRRGLDAEARRQVEAVRLAGDAMLHLVEDLLDASRDDDDIQLQPVRLEELIEETAAVWRPAALDKGLAFEVAASPAATAAPVLSDRLRLRQALSRLIANAVKFTQAGGVRVEADYVEGRVLLSVADTGCGVDAAMRSRLFQLFNQADDSTTRRHEGAGLGLALAQRAASRLGGGVRFETPEGGGSIFIVDTPARQATAAPDREASPLPRVLIVDDHAVNRDLLRLMLQAAGCETEEAADGAEAVQAVASGVYDLVLMDVRMPGMDGLAATRAIRRLPAPACDAPILAVTADAMPDDVTRCLAAGMDAHLAKPVTQTKLHEAMAAALDAAAARLDVAA